MPIDNAPLLPGDALETDSAVCRICHAGSGAAGEEESELLSPCLCSGSVQWVHRRCLEEWRQKGSQGAPSRVAFCELCGFRYRFEMRKCWRLEAVADSLVKAVCASSPLLALGWLLGAWKSKEVAVLTSGSLLGIAAAQDAVASAAALQHGQDWSGGLGSYIMYLLVVSSPTLSSRVSCLRGVLPRLASSQPEATADEAAALQAQAIGNMALRLQADMHRQQGHTPNEELPHNLVEGSWQCCSYDCLLGTVAFLAFPPLCSLMYWVLISVLGAAGMKIIAGILTLWAVTYFGVLYSVWLCIAVCCPPPKARLGSNGLPTVRSLTAEERGFACQNHSV
mmetsp:Transcript_4203/g.7142  ORF Transcript_4203/g.7142 Transcript_4203/m.7142 type:complete len:337 (+) Transcript_4203:58-1068(+)